MNLETKNLMEKAVEHLTEQLAGIRFGVPTCALIDTIKVDYYGQQTSINHMAHTMSQQGKIDVVPHDPTMLGVVDKALKEAGFNSYMFSKTTVSINLPKYAGEADREKVILQVHNLEEAAKVAIRNIRKKARQKLVGSEDEIKRADKELQDMNG